MSALVLVVDDDEDNALIASEILLSRGFEVRVARDLEAVDVRKSKVHDDEIGALCPGERHGRPSIGSLQDLIALEGQGLDHDPAIVRVRFAMRS